MTSESCDHCLKFSRNIPLKDLRCLAVEGASLTYPLPECSRGGRVNWKLRLHRSDEGPDPGVALGLKFEPQVCTESVRCVAELAFRVAAPTSKASKETSKTMPTTMPTTKATTQTAAGIGLERRSAGGCEFTRCRQCWGWQRFATVSELEALAHTDRCSVSLDAGEAMTTQQPPPPAPPPTRHLKLSGSIRVREASALLYPGRRYNFDRRREGADFRLRVSLATFHTHRSVLALHSDYFAGLLARPDSLEARTGRAVLSEDRIQFMYPGYGDDVIDDVTLFTLARLAAKYGVHTLAWRCMHYIDDRLGENQASLNAERLMLYYAVCRLWLRCGELAEYCVRLAARLLPWRGGVREAEHFRRLTRPERAAFLQAYLDWRDLPQSLPTAMEPNTTMSGHN